MVSSETLFIIERGHGAPVVLLHGQPGTHEHLDPIAERLLGDALVLSVDRHGYGRTLGGARPMAEQVALLAAALEVRCSAPAVVVGHSYGGGIALLLAAAHPELVAGLVLVGSVGGDGSLALIDTVMAAPVVGPVVSWVSLAAYGVIAPVLARIGNNPSLATNVPAMPTLDLVEDLRTFMAEQRFLLREHDSLQRACEAITCPVIVVQGALDSIVPPEAGVDLADRVEGAELILVEGQGHLIPRDAPDVIVDAVRSLLG